MCRSGSSCQAASFSGWLGLANTTRLQQSGMIPSGGGGGCKLLAGAGLAGAGSGMMMPCW